MASPVVSIVIPTYNRAHLIGETLQTVLAQTFADFEVLVIDDGSRDNTAEIMEDWCRRDARIRYIQQTNGGVSSARNHGLRLAQGEFIAFLDSDDLWVPWKLQIQVALMRAQPQVGMMWSNMDAIDEQGKLLELRHLRTMYKGYQGKDEQFPFNQSRTVAELVKAVDIPAELPGKTAFRVGRILRPMIHGNLVHTSTVLIRRSVAEQVGPFPEVMRKAGEDYDYHLRTCAKTEVAYLDISTVLYRIGMGDQITHPSNNLNFARSYLASIEPFLADATLVSPSERNSILASAHRWLGEQLLEHGEHRESRSHLARSLRYQLCSLATLKLITKTVLPTGVLNQLRKWRGAKNTVATY